MVEIREIGHVIYMECCNLGSQDKSRYGNTWNEVTKFQHALLFEKFLVNVIGAMSILRC